MKCLVAVKSCERDARNGFNQVMRDTWIKDVYGADVVFFMGQSTIVPKNDEVQLDCPDDYMSLPHKTRAIINFALHRDYDFVFFCDTDTYVIPKRLFESGFESYDLTGLFNGRIGVPNATEGKYWAWISGGNGYWLSRRAMRIIDSCEPPTDWAEDRMIGQVLGPYFMRGDLKAFSHQDYGFHTDGNTWLTRITSHYCSQGLKRKFDVSWMKKRYAYNILGVMNP